MDTTHPVADSGFEQISLVGNTAIFNASASNDNLGITSYEWDFGDGSTGKGRIATHTYTSDGVYSVMLTVRDHAGNISTDVMSVDIQATGVDPELIIVLLGSAFAIGMAGILLLLKKRGRAKCLVLNKKLNKS